MCFTDTGTHMKPLVDIKAKKRIDDGVVLGSRHGKQMPDRARQAALGTSLKLPAIALPTNEK